MSVNPDDLAAASEALRTVARAFPEQQWFANFLAALDEAVAAAVSEEADRLTQGELMPQRACLVCSRPSDQARCERHRVQRASTTERGYGAAHQKLRAQLIAALDPDQPCPRCGEPLGDDPSVLDLGHTDARDGYSGLEHDKCNRSARRNRDDR